MFVAGGDDDDGDDDDDDDDDDYNVVVTAVLLCCCPSSENKINVHEQMDTVLCSIVAMKCFDPTEGIGEEIRVAQNPQIRVEQSLMQG